MHYCQKKKKNCILKPNTDQKRQYTNAKCEKEGDLEMFWDET